MPELRWVLIAVGVLFVAGLWLWESRRPRERESPGSTAEGRGSPRTEPRLDGASGEAARGSDEPAAEPSPPSAPIRAIRRERVGPPDPPVVEIPAGVEPELAPQPHDSGEITLTIPYREMQQELEARAAAGIEPEPPHDEYTRREPWVRTQPLDREEIRRAQEEEDAADRARSQEQFGGSADRELASRQRIVALRLVATGERWPGRAVVDALEAEGLAYGKYSVFHREHASGKSLFYAASMVEPGSFDLENLDSLSFPGISLFAVVPGPVECPVVFDMMLATGRRLAEALEGQLQDEQGSTLTAQRILSLREDLVHLEHLSRRLRGA
jgi:cell division protein ZipA